VLLASRLLAIIGLCLCFAPFALAQKPANKVCVTLAGGVARGFAFLGALEELVTNGVPVDCIVGTSAGALVGGLYASGYSFQTLRQRLPELQLRQSQLVRVLFPPLNGILDPSGFEVVYRALVGSMRLEDTSPRLTVMVTPLERGTTRRALETGDLASAMRASISLPLVFPTAQIDGAYYTDGGLRDPYPVGVARELGADVVIAIRGQPEPDAPPTNLIGTLNAVTNAVLSGTEQVQPDLWIRVKAFDTLYFDFSKVQELMERGREAARALLPDVKRLLESKRIALNPSSDPHTSHPVNALWDTRLEAGLEDARALPVPFTVAPAIELAPSSYDAGTLPGSRSAFSTLGIGLDVGGGPLGRFSIGAGYASNLDSPDDAPFVRVSYAAQPFRLSASYDSARRPIGAAWRLEAALDLSNLNLHASLDAAAFSIGGSSAFRFGALRLYPRVALRFGYAPSLRLETSLAAQVNLEPVFFRARALVGLGTGGASGFSLGYNSLLRGYPVDYAISPQALIVNLELGYRFSLGNLAGLLSAEPELRVFADAGLALDVNRSTASWLWDLGLGISVPGRWFGFLPFNFGADVAAGPAGLRFNFFTAIALP
jgi:NTE family protein